MRLDHNILGLLHLAAVVVQQLPGGGAGLADAPLHCDRVAIRRRLEGILACSGDSSASSVDS